MVLERLREQNPWWGAPSAIDRDPSLRELVLLSASTALDRSAEIGPADRLYTPRSEAGGEDHCFEDPGEAPDYVGLPFRERALLGVRTAGRLRVGHVTRDQGSQEGQEALRSRSDRPSVTRTDHL